MNKSIKSNSIQCRKMTPVSVYATQCQIYQLLSSLMFPYVTNLLCGRVGKYSRAMRTVNKTTINSQLTLYYTEGFKIQRTDRF